jgi:hypothetical protein
MRQYLRAQPVVFLLALVTMLGASETQAQEDAEGVQYKKKTVINFEDDTIEGDLKTPDGQYLEVRARMRHRSLIRIRTEFRREVLGSIADL